MSSSITPESSGRDGSSTKNIDDSLDILQDGCGARLCTKNIEGMSTSLTPESDRSRAKNIDDSLDILSDSCGGRLSMKNVEEMSLSIVGENNSSRAKNIDDSLDILSDCSDAAVVPVTSDDSGRSSCQSSVLSTLPTASHRSPSTSPAYLMTSTQSAHTVSTSSSFNDLQLHCFSSDGSSL